MYVSRFEHRPKECWTIAGRLAALLIVATGAELVAAAPPVANMNWHEIDTAHFRILTWLGIDPPSNDSYLELTCEEAMTRVLKYWFGGVVPLDRKCDIVLYPDDESYMCAVGRNAMQTAGAVLTRFDGKHTYSRIKLSAKRSQWESNCLPHELTHVLFAQRFAGRKLPAWINEGTGQWLTQLRSRLPPSRLPSSTCKSHVVSVDEPNVLARLPT